MEVTEVAVEVPKRNWTGEDARRYIEIVDG
jgi:hypothetical protein